MNKKTTTVCCPVCSGDMEIRELECTDCNIQVRGHFGRESRFDQLTPEQKSFLETFLRCRGVLRDVEAALGISYPTVRARLDTMLSSLGFADGVEPAPATEDTARSKAMQRKDILAAIDSGAMDAATALEALNNLK